MELEEMKIAWEEMSADIQKQKKLTDSLIIKMTQVNYRNKTLKIAVPETIGSLGCMAMALFIAIHFRELHTWYLHGCGIIALITLLLLPIMSFRSICAITAVHVQDNNYKESLLQYSNGKKKFVIFQKINFYLGSILLVVILPVSGQLIAGKDVFEQHWIWLWFSTSFVFFYILGSWIFKKYVKIINEAETILQELEE